MKRSSRGTPRDATSRSLPGVLMLGTGEYTTGFTDKGASDSDKSTGVVALVMLDLRRRGKVGRLGMCGTNGCKMPAIRAHMQRALGDVYADIDPSCIESWPADGVRDASAYKEAIGEFEAGDVAIIFTPDDTHLAIAKTCLTRGMHVLITKPPVKTLSEHNELAAMAATADRLIAIEVHKRYDPMYADARDRMGALGAFSYFSSYMSQPKHQLDTFRAWAGVSSDISYYLNSHHVDFHSWCMRGRARAERVSAFASEGVASARLGNGITTEDTITLAVTWRNRQRAVDGSNDGGNHRGMDGAYDGAAAHSTYTASWIAPRADVHSQQRWFYMGARGELTVDQAHRGYSSATDDAGFGAINPLFWKPARDASTGAFAGQRCYGYLSFEAFIDAAAACNEGTRRPAEYDDVLPTLAATADATAILEAGRRSLDAHGQPFELIYKSADAATPVQIRAVQFDENAKGRAH